MPYAVRDQVESNRIIDCVIADCTIYAHGYRPPYVYPTSKDRKRIAVICDPEFGDLKRMMDTLDTLTAKFDDPIVYMGGLTGEETSYGNNLVMGWAKYYHYERYSLRANGGSHKRNEKMCQLCTHLAAFHNGDNTLVETLIGMARAEELKVKIIPYEIKT